MAETTRREFMTTSLLASAGVCLGALGSSGCEKQGEASTVAPEAGTVTVDPATKPALEATGGSIILEVDGVDDSILLVRRKDDSYVAVSRKCTHLGCKVKYSLDDDELVCPCHGSRFAADGSVTHGPAKTPLPSYPVALEGSLVKIRVSS